LSGYPLLDFDDWSPIFHIIRSTQATHYGKHHGNTNTT